MAVLFESFLSRSRTSPKDTVFEGIWRSRLAYFLLTSTGPLRSAHEHDQLFNPDPRIT